MMFKKRGVAIAALTLTIAIVAILSSTVVISVNKSMEGAKINSFVREHLIIQDAVKSYVNGTTLNKCIINIIEVDVSTMKEESVNEQFAGETIQNNKILLYSLDLGRLGILNTKHGNLKNEKDIYVISKETNKIYYLSGIKNKGKYYYTVTEELRIKLRDTQINTQEEKSSQVLFKPNTSFWTNEAVLVKVILPEEINLTRITIKDAGTTEIELGTPYIEDGYTKIDVNIDSVETNYTINVTYSLAEEELTAIYRVMNFDDIPPEINIGEQILKKGESQIEAYILDIKALDNKSDIKYLRYEKGEVEENYEKYFEVYGRDIEQNKIQIEEGYSKYTIYAEDYAGNKSIFVVEIEDDIINNFN